MEATAVERGYKLILCTAGYDHQRAVQYLKMIRSRAIDGVFHAAGGPPTDSELNPLPGDTPMMFVDGEIHDTTFGSVVLDNYEGGRIAAEQLVSPSSRGQRAVCRGRP